MRTWLSSTWLRHAVGALVLAASTAGCSARTVTLTARSGVEQELLVRSLERAIAGLETAWLRGRRASLELTGLTADHAFAREFIATHLRARGVSVVDGTAPADVRLRAFATVLGVDHGESLLGIPALQVPIVSVPLPEIALFKWTRHRSLAEVQMFAFDADTGRLLERIPDAVGRAKFDRFTVLLVIGFTVDDLGDRPPIGR
jgi:hypothetical protein